MSVADCLSEPKRSKRSAEDRGSLLGACFPSRPAAAKCQTNTAGSKIKLHWCEEEGIGARGSQVKNRDCSAPAGRVRRAAERLSTREAAVCC